MKSRKLMIPILLGCSLVLTACGSGDKDQQTNKVKATVSISDGVKEMKQTLTDLKAQVKKKNAEKVKESGEQLELSWQKFEDQVKVKSSNLYEKVETPLHTIEAGAKSEPLDQQILQKAANELDSVLTDVEKLK